MCGQKIEHGQNAKQAQIWMERAIEALKVGETVKCLEYGRRAVELDSGNARLWFRNGLFYYHLGRHDEALECYDRALQIDPQYGKVWFNKGLLLGSRQQFREAVGCFDSAINLLPDNSEPIYHKGRALQDAGEFKKAIECYDRVLAMNGTHSGAWDGKGRALAALNKEDDAIQCYEMYTRLNPDDGNGWYNKGVSEQSLGRNEEALISYDNALSCDPKHGSALGNKGVLLFNNEKYVEALVCFERAVEFGNIKAANGITSCKERLASEQSSNLRFGGGEFKPGDVIENYLVVHDVKRGGMGIVYLCYDNALERPVAVKTFQDKYLASVKSRRRFLEEGRTWARLMKHPNIVECYSAFESLEGHPYLNLEYVEGVKNIGVSLRDWITKKRLDIVTIIDFATQICTAMQYAQIILPGFVHRDLKPENILITSNRKVKVTDFGLAKVVENDVAKIDRGGTVPYMSPEQVKSLDLDERSDIYALGCILYEMLTDHMVFPVSSVEEFLRCHIEVKPVSPSSIVSIPTELDVLVMQCLEKDCDRRPTTFGEIAETLMSIYEHYTGRKMINADAAPSQEYELVNKALALHHLGCIEEGLNLLSKVMHESNSPNHWLVRGNMLLDLGRYQEALEAYEMFLSFDQEDSEAIAGWINRGNCLDYLGRSEEALKSYDKALAIDNKSYETWLNKAATLKRIGRVDEAQKYIDAYLKIDPKDRDFLHAKACLLNYQQQYQEAIEYFNKVLEIDPMFSHAWNDKGAAFFSLGKWRQALSCFDRLLEIDKLDAHAWCNRGLALNNLGQFDEAIASFDHALALNPDYPDVRKIRDEVVARRFSSR